MKTAYALLATTIISSVALHGVSISLTQFSNEMTQTSEEVSETLISQPEDFDHLGFFMAEDLHIDFSNSLSDRSLEGVHHARMLAEVIANLERHAQELQEDPASWLGDPNPDGGESFDSDLFRQWARYDPSAALEWVNSSTTVVPEPKSFALIAATLSFLTVVVIRRSSGRSALS